MDRIISSTVIIGVTGVILTYMTSRMLNLAPSWPGATITETSNHFPSYIVFRGSMIYTVPLVQFIFYVKYLQMKQFDLIVGKISSLPKMFLWTSMISYICAVFSLSTIDTNPY